MLNQDTNSIVTVLVVVVVVVFVNDTVYDIYVVE